MRAISGVFVTKSTTRRNGTVTVPFDAVQGEGSDVGDATIHKVTRVYEGDDVMDRYFHSDPAYIAHIREAKLEDRTRGSHGSETDWMEINSECNEQRLRITWNAHDPGSQVIEIGFMIVGL
jgi:hypothetical protein